LLDQIETLDLVRKAELKHGLGDALGERPAVDKAQLLAEGVHLLREGAHRGALARTRP